MTCQTDRPKPQLLAKFTEKLSKNVIHHSSDRWHGRCRLGLARIVSAGPLANDANEDEENDYEKTDPLKTHNLHHNTCASALCFQRQHVYQYGCRKE